MDISKISSSISAVIAVLGLITPFIYNGYVVFHLGYMEKKLLTAKSKAKMNLYTGGITLLAIVLLMVAHTLTQNKALKIFLEVVIIVYVILVFFGFFYNEYQEKYTLIKFNYKDITYVFMNRIDDNTISALPENVYEEDKGNTKVTLFQLSDLSNVNFYTGNSFPRVKRLSTKQSEEISLGVFNKLLVLKAMLDASLINQDEYDKKKKQLLNL